MAHDTDTYVEWGCELPDSYEEDRIVALVRDPDCLAFYWDAQASKRNLVARVKRLTDGVHYDIDLPETLATWHLPAQSDSTYQVELHRRREDGSLALLAQSQEVALPVRHAEQAAHKPAEVRHVERRAAYRPEAAPAARPAETEPVSPPEALAAPSAPPPGAKPGDYTNAL